MQNVRIVVRHYLSEKQHNYFYKYQTEKMSSVSFSMPIRIGAKTLLHLQKDILLKDSEIVR